jgi:hypothetical protein
MKVEQKTESVTVRLPIKRNAEWVQQVLMMSDLHWDHPWSDRVGIKDALDQALAINAPILINGDALCLMQGPGDRRATGGMRLPEHDRPDYIDAVIDTFCEFMEPYKHLIALYGAGNHETSITKHHGTSPHRRICEKLGVPRGGYHGYVLFRFEGSNNAFRTTKRMYYHHGMGNGGKQSGASLVLRNMRQSAVADIYWAGHTHYSESVPGCVTQCSDAGEVSSAPQLSISTPSWKDEWLRPGGWAIERGMGPKPIGAYWLKFNYRRSRGVVFRSEEVI